MLIQTFYTGGKLTTRLGHWYKYPPKLQQIYCPQNQTIRHTTEEGTFSSPIHLTRTHIRNLEDWSPINTYIRGQPMIEDSQL